MTMFRGVAAVICSSFIITGCSKSPEEKMTAICTDVAKLSVSDPSALVVNSSSVISRQATEESLTRFSHLGAKDQLSVDQKAALEVYIREISKIQEAYAAIDFTDKSSVARRDSATCWFMDRGTGYQLGSVSVQGKSYSGIDLTSLFIDYKKPEYLGPLNQLQ